MAAISMEQPHRLEAVIVRRRLTRIDTPMSGDEMVPGVPLEDVAHIVQVALTPVFLLSGIASLLNVINPRQGGLADTADGLHEQLLAAEGAEAGVLGGRLPRMRRRRQVIDVARSLPSASVRRSSRCSRGARNTAVATGLFLCSVPRSRAPWSVS